MEETQKRTTGPEVLPEVPPEINYVRETPNVTVHRVGDHYIVTVGCRTGVFHTPGGVGEFLHQLLAEWIKNELMDPRRILGLAGMDRIRPTTGLPKYAEEPTKRPLTHESESA